MFTVECPECKVSYQVDERRVPANGLRMRCPKCSAAFVVEKPETAGAPTPAAPVRPAHPVAPAAPAASVGGAGRAASIPEPPAQQAAKAIPIQPATPQAAVPAQPAAARPPPPAPRRAPAPAPPPPSATGAGAGAAASNKKPARPVRAEGVGSEAKPKLTPPEAVENAGLVSGHATVRKMPASFEVAPEPQPGADSQMTSSKRSARAPVDEELLPQPVAARAAVGAAGVSAEAAARGSTGGAAIRAEVVTPAQKVISTPALDADLPELIEPNRAQNQKGGSLRAVDESDLPAPRESVDSYLPAALGSSAKVPRVATPIPSTAKLPNLDLGLDLPSLSSRKADAARETRRDSVDISAGPIELDLPSLAAPITALPDRQDTGIPADVGDLEFELPSPMGTQKTTAIGLGSPEVAPPRRVPVPNLADLPDLAPDLPIVASPLVGLPNLRGKPDTSKRTLAGTGAGTAPVEPAPQAPTLPEIDLGLEFESTAGGSLPPAPSVPPGSPFSPAFGRTVARSTQGARGIGEEVGSSLLPPAAKGTEFGVTARGASQPPLPVPEGLGGTAYGEVRLESAGAELSVETESPHSRRSLSGDALEFGAVPEAAEPAAATAGADAATRPAPIEEQSAAKPPPSSAESKGMNRPGNEPSSPSVKGSGRARIFGMITFATLALAGGALSLVPDLGPYGTHFLSDQIHRKANAALVRQTIESCHKVLAADDFSGVSSALSSLRTAQREHERLRELKAYYALFAYMVELRHGNLPQERARAKVILDELANHEEVKHVGIAKAVRAAVEGNLAKARHAIVTLSATDGRDPDVAFISAEIAMLERRYSEALQSWQQVERLESSARASYGAARAYHALGQYDAAKSDALQAISRNKGHVGARLILARIALEKGDLEQAQRYIAEALGLTEQQSPVDFVVAKTLSGDLQLMGSRISLAEASYQEALAKDPRSSAALRGLGETLYRAGRYSESLARFEAGLQADPDDVLVAVGVAKAELALERVREAATVLGRLRQSNSKHYAVNYWYGRTEEAAGDRDEAEKAYATAIEVGGSDPMVVDAYVAMALLKNQQGRREEAQKVLLTAQEKLPRLPKIFDAIGQLALSEGRYASAIEQFNQALELNPTDLGVKFRLGTALRKNRDFESATKVFEAVTEVDRDYPGLALEWGQLYEASGHTEKALQAFESALAKAPNDPDLMLRVGCGKVAAGRSQQAEQLLKKVLEQRPTSAETHHCLGRAQLLEGSNLATALRTLERAEELDPHRAEYHLYVGWAANEAGRVALAEQSLKKALELDQGLGDAFWQRGVLRYRQGAVKDAVVDLTRALELMPGRYEAHAALADAYFDLGLEPKALEQWRLATVAQPDNATWRFRYGKLLQAARRDGEARQELEAALELAAKLPEVPRWAWEAHHLLARAIGHQPTAIKHWEAFLELAPRDNVYRDEAKQALVKLGKPWTRD